MTLLLVLAVHADCRHSLRVRFAGESAHIVSVGRVDDDALTPEAAAAEYLHYRVEVQPVHDGNGQRDFARMSHARFHPVFASAASQPSIDGTHSQIVRGGRRGKAFAVEIRLIDLHDGLTVDLVGRQHRKGNGFDLRLAEEFLVHGARVARVRTH